MISIRGQYKKKILVHEKNIIIQLIKTVIFNMDTRSAELFMVPAPGIEVVQCHSGRTFQGVGDNDWKEKMGRKSCCPQHGTVRDTGLGDVSQESLGRGGEAGALSVLQVYSPC